MLPTLTHQTNVFTTLCILATTSHVLPENLLRHQEESQNLRASHEEVKAYRFRRHEPQRSKFHTLSEESIKSIINSTKLNFCECGNNFVSTFYGCQPLNTTINLNINRRFPLTVNTRDIKSEVMKPVCGNMKSLLHFPHGSFSVLKGGLVMIKSVGTVYPLDHFCLQQIYKGSINKEDLESGRSNLNPDSVSLEANICVKNTIPKCCEELDITDSSTNRNQCKRKLTSSVPLFEEDAAPINPQNSVNPVIMFGNSKVNWNFSSAYVSRIQCPSNYKLTRIPLNLKDVQFYQIPQGSVMKLVKGDFHVDYKHNELCIEKEQDEFLLSHFYVYFCHENYSQRTNSRFPSFFPKCCPEHQIFREDENKCGAHLKSNDYFFEIKIQMFEALSYNPVSGHSSSNSSMNDSDTPNFEEIEDHFYNIKSKYGIPACQYVTSNLSSEHHISWLADGSLKYRNKTLPPGSFCVETVSSPDSQGKLDNPVPQLLSCVEEDQNSMENCEWTSMLVISLMTLSCISLAGSLVTFIAVPGTFKDPLSGRCIISEMVALLISFLLYTISLLFSESISETLTCTIIGIINHIAVLATFFWISVISFIALTTILMIRDRRRCETTHFLKLSLFAWGIPTLIAVVTAVIDFLPPNYDVIRPNTRITCFPGHDRLSHWVYVYVPIAVLLTFNLFIYIYINWELCSLCISRNSLNSGTKSNFEKKLCAAQRRKNIKTYIYIFIVMGVSWIAEVLSFEFKSCGIWVLTDCFNSLKGVFICMVAFWDRRASVNQGYKNFRRNVLLSRLKNHPKKEANSSSHFEEPLNGCADSSGSATVKHQKPPKN